MEQLLRPIDEESRPPEPDAVVAGGQGGEARDVCHITGFSGGLLQLDRVLFVASCGLYVLVTVFFVVGEARIWSPLLIAIFLLAVVDYVVLRCRKAAMAQDRSIRRFMYGMPFAWFCFYGEAITFKTQDCTWYIAVEDDNLRLLIQVGTYLTGWVAVLAIALGALRIDCNGSASVSQRVRGSRVYALCHVLFRATELSFRLSAGVVLCESLRVLYSTQLALPLFVCVPFLCLVCIYALMLQSANYAGGKPMDGPLSCLVLGVVSLVMNPLHFFARSGYHDATRLFNKALFLTRVVEVVAVGGVLSSTVFMFVPEGLCYQVAGQPRKRGLDLIWRLGVGVVPACQAVISLAVHYLIMALHSDIQHGTCQALTGEAGGGTAARVQAAFPRPGQRSLFVPPPPAGAGLGRAWLQLGGGLPLSPFAAELTDEQLDKYRLMSVLGGGSFGVVVRVQRLTRDGDAPLDYALKLLNTSDQYDAQLAHREASIYSNIWLCMRELSPGFHRVGHPNIVRLHFYSNFDSGRVFEMQGGGGEPTVVKHPASRNTEFHMALMMEFCETNLEKYITRHHKENAEWFGLIVHFLAEVLLGLSFLHSHNVTYRDLKPENVLIVRSTGGGGSPDMPNVHCKLGDFGYGRVADPEAGGARCCSAAGTAYFCAPEMEERVRHGVLEATLAEEKALDTYSFGTVAFACAYGPGYLQEQDVGKMGNRIDHPRCQGVAGGGRCGHCAGCRLLNEMGRKWLPLDPRGLLKDLIGRCVMRQALHRPNTAGLLGDAYFQGRADFDALVRLPI